MTGNSRWRRTSLIVAGCVVLQSALLTIVASGSEKFRVYPFGESDPGAVVGGVALVTQDSIASIKTHPIDGTPVGDAEGDFVPWRRSMEIWRAPTRSGARGGHRCR